MSERGSGQAPRGTREWDATTYDRVSEPQLAWGRKVIARLNLTGAETVVDAGCGSGRVTEVLAEALPEGRVIGVDGSQAMLDRAGERLGDRAELVHSDLLELDLGRVADAVFSAATFHWIDDHQRLFDRLAACLHPGGRIEAQCGGTGNVERFFAIVADVEGTEPFASHLAEARPVHNFQGPDETEQRLQNAGFVGARCWLEPADTWPPEPRTFIESACLGAHLELLPEELRTQFVDAIFERWGPDPVLDYVRLNISAIKA